MEVGYALEKRVDAGGLNRLLPAQLVFPTDLRAWISENELGHIVNEAVQHADHTGVRVEFTPHWDSLLARTTAAYAVGIFSSDEISAVTGELPIDGGAPIRHFRRCNRAVLQRTLASILQACAAKHHLSATPWDAFAPVDSAASEAEASARIARAIEVDSWAIDGD